MTWHLTLFALDIACVFALALLMRDAPDWMQRSAIRWLIAGFAVLVVGRAVALAGDEESAELIIHLGLTTCHLGVIVYILRLFVAEQARRCLPKSSKLSRS